MTAVGAMIGTGSLPGFLTLLLASLGALTGDTIGYWCGRLFKDSIDNIWPFRKYPKLLNYSQAFFQKHGGKSIIIGRFFGPARSTVPLVAGMLKMGWWRFFIAAIPSAILWAIIYTIPGILIGAISVELPPKKMTQVLIAGITIIILLWFAFWLIQLSFRWLVSYFDKKIDALWRWMGAHHGSRTIIRGITNQQQPNNHHQLTRFILCFISIVLFAVSYLCAVLHTSYTHINMPLFHLFQSIRGKHLDTFFILTTFLGKPIVVSIAALLVSACLFLKKQRRAAMHLLMVIVITGVAVSIFKHLLYFQRPTGFHYFDPSSSIPSGHFTLSLCIYGFCALLTNDCIKKTYHWISFTVATILIALIGFSRLYLGMHWMTDIITSLFLGWAILLFVCISYRRFPHKHSKCHLSLFAWLSILLPCILIVWGIYAKTHFKLARFQHTPINVVRSIKQQNWWRHPLRYLPVFRDNRFGHPIEPLNVQWQGTIKVITASLNKMGWHVIVNSEKQNQVKHDLGEFAQRHLKYHIPLLPVLFDNARPALIASKYDNDRAVLLYLWPANIRFNQHKNSLWIGTVREHKAHQSIRFATSLLLNCNPRGNFNVIAKSVTTKQSNYTCKVIRANISKLPKHFREYNWDRKIIVIR